LNRLISTQKDLQNFIETLKLDATTPISLDTEFERRTSYFPKLALIQLHIGGNPYLIDPLTLDLSPLKPLWQNTSLKIIHSGKQDLEIIWQLFGCTVTPLFDTQIAAALCSLGDGLGYNTLVHTVVGAHVSKSQQKTNWLKRPLTAKQLTYAEKDVTYLPALFESLSAKLAEMGRTPWLEEVQNRFYNTAAFTLTPTKAWSKLNLHTLKWGYVSMVMDLATWREEESIRQNRHRLLVMPDAIIHALAQNTYTTFEDFLGCCAPYKPLFEDEAVLGSLFQAYTQALEKRTLPERKPFVEEQLNLFYKPPKFKPAVQACINKLRHLTTNTAQQLGIPHYYVAERREIEKFALAPSVEHPFLTTWRQAFFADVCAPYLAAD
jgi:ribonuclease D